MALRFDRYDLGAVERTPQGGIKVPANLTRPGVFAYTQPDGSIRREYRPPSEVFGKAHMASLIGAPVTNLHPDTATGRIDSATWRIKAVGHAGEHIRQDQGHVAADVYVQDAETISLIENGQRDQISLGYDQDLVIGAGVTPEGEPYDATQTNIRANHIALVPKGRAGTARLRLDSAGDEIACATMETPMQIKIAGKEYTAGSPEAIAALAALEAAGARADALDAEVKRHRAKALADLRAVGKTHGAEFRADADASEVMIATLKKLAPGVSVDGMSDDWVQGAFAVAIAMALDLNEPEPTADAPAGDDKTPAPGAPAAAEARADAIDARRKAAKTDTSRDDAADTLPPDVLARQKMITAGRNMRAKA